MLFFLPLPIKRKTLYNGRIPIDSIVISSYNYNAIIVNVVSGFFPNFVSVWCASVSFQFYFKPHPVLQVFLKSVNKLFPLCLWELVSKDGVKLSYGTANHDLQGKIFFSLGTKLQQVTIKNSCKCQPKWELQRNTFMWFLPHSILQSGYTFEFWR